MALTLSNTNAEASHYLSINQSKLQRSLKKLSSGKKLVDPTDDPGGLAVSMKLQASLNRLSSAQRNVQNGISFLEVQDGLLDTVGKIVTRMSELKGLASQDPLKGTDDIASYNNEFKDLQVQLYSMSRQKFNGVSLFGAEGKTFNRGSTSASDFSLVSIHASAEGSSGPKISIHKAMLASALIIKSDGQAGGTTSDLNFAAEEAGDALEITNASISIGTINGVIDNIAYLRSQNGGSASRLAFAAQNLAQQQTNLSAALGRIEDVDIAAETANLAKYMILTQASASMVAQANSVNEIALMLLR